MPLTPGVRGLRAGLGWREYNKSSFIPLLVSRGYGRARLAESAEVIEPLAAVLPLAADGACAALLAQGEVVAVHDAWRGTGKLGGIQGGGGGDAL